MMSPIAAILLASHLSSGAIINYCADVWSRYGNIVHAYASLGADKLVEITVRSAPKTVPRSYREAAAAYVRAVVGGNPKAVQTTYFRVVNECVQHINTVAHRKAL